MAQRAVYLDYLSLREQLLFSAQLLTALCLSTIMCFLGKPVNVYCLSRYPRHIAKQMDLA